MLYAVTIPLQFNREFSNRPHNLEQIPERQDSVTDVAGRKISLKHQLYLQITTDFHRPSQLI